METLDFQGFVACDLKNGKIQRVYSVNENYASIQGHVYFLPYHQHDLIQRA